MDDVQYNHSRNNPRKRIILDLNHDQIPKPIRKYDNSTCNRFCLIRHWARTCSTQHFMDQT